MRPAKLLLHIKSSLWFVPVLCVLAGAGISFGTIALPQLELLAAATQRAMDDERDAEMALHPDREGIGAAVAAER